MAREQEGGNPKAFGAVVAIIGAVIAIILGLIAIANWFEGRVQPAPCPELQKANETMTHVGLAINKGFPRLMCREPAEFDLPMNWDPVVIDAKSAAADFSTCKKNSEAEEGLTRALIVQKMARYATSLAKDPANVPEYEDWQSIRTRLGNQPQPAFVTARLIERNLDRAESLWLQHSDAQRRGPCADGSGFRKWDSLDHAISLDLKALAQDPRSSGDPNLGALGCAWMFRAEQVAHEADCAGDQALKTDAAVVLERARDKGAPDGDLLDFQVELIAGATPLCPLEAVASRQLRAKVVAAFARDEETLGDHSVADADKSKLIDEAVDAVSKGKAGYNEWHRAVAKHEWNRSALPEAGLHVADADIALDQPEDALIVLQSVTQRLKPELEQVGNDYRLDLFWGKAACLAGGKPAADIEERLKRAAGSPWTQNLGNHWGFAAPLGDMCAAAEGRLTEGKLIASIHAQVAKMESQHIDPCRDICEMRDHKAFWLRLESRAPAFVREWDRECPRDPCASETTAVPATNGGSLCPPR